LLAEGTSGSEDEDTEVAASADVKKVLDYIKKNGLWVSKRWVIREEG